ncbi:hypothetical protein [Ilumatobacter coccineus]|uniref:hypothetical protein n=1 Tax=Ilumatobacter coccineus TaxID=467094 RepID=UPI0012B67E9E|nr:hypothetical protein [Ilumatobacter coccineus]
MHPHLGQIGLGTQPRPRLCEGRTARCDHLGDPVAADTLGLGPPHDVELFEPAVATPDVILLVVERRAPSGSLELTPIELLHAAVLTTTKTGHAERLTARHRPGSAVPG